MALEETASQISLNKLLGELCDGIGVTRDVFDDVAEPLRRFVDSLNESASLHPTGALRVERELQTWLRQRLEIKSARPRHPGSFKRSVRKPLFIASLPRTGTAFLHHLFSLDKAIRAPRLWELSYPLPPPEPFSYESNPQISQTEHDVRTLLAATPALKGMRLIEAQAPAPCSHIFERALMGVRMITDFRVPGFADWFWAQPLEAPYRWYKDELLLLQTNVLGDWVLRSPFHQWGVETLLAEFPDALLVQVHRDPLQMLASGASLCETLRRGYSDSVDPLACGEDCTALVERYVGHFADWRKRVEAGGSAPVVDVSYSRLMADPLAILGAIYRAWDKKLGLEARMRMQAWLKGRPKDDGGEQSPEPARYGIDADLVQRRFGAYIERYGEYF